jgi:membrane protein implicated in regulation of membrane protease activity
MAWWLWILIGIALLVVELLTPGGLFALFFGVGALATGVLAFAGAPAVIQWLAFSVISVVLLATLRRVLQERLRAHPGAAIDSLVGEEVVLLGEIPAGGEGQAELRGVPWKARAASGIPLHAGQRCRVERVDGVTLWVRAESRPGSDAAAPGGTSWR